MNNKDIRLDLLCKLQSNPEFSQRKLSQEIGTSLGKVNCCLQRPISKGWIKLTNFSRSSNKLSYMSRLTPIVMEQKVTLTTSFLKTKLDEFEILKDEISQLKLHEQKIANEKR